MRDPIVEFQNYNRPFLLRHPDLVRQKIQRMAVSPFTFFRGSLHLYVRDFIDRLLPSALPETSTSPDVDIVGDIHGENYGTFKAGDDAVHYDINDFDETTRGPWVLDICRLATSCCLVAQDRSETLERAMQVTLRAVAGY